MTPKYGIIVFRTVGRWHDGENCTEISKRIFNNWHKFKKKIIKHLSKVTKKDLKKCVNWPTIATNRRNFGKKLTKIRCNAKIHQK